jgi:dTMP kinase
MPSRTTSHESLAAVKLIAKSMPVRGKFIVLEGIDGSGKRTQIEALAREFGRRRMPFLQVGFPNYGGFFGKLVARFLNGEFGPLAGVDPHFSALLYAGDRLESKPAIESALAAGQIVLADRYVASNLAHQGARVPREKRSEFLGWLKQLEYEVHALPVEDLVIYLRLSPAEAHRLVGRKGARDYTKSRRDLQEADLGHLETASQVYDELARQTNWMTIECFDTRSGALRAPAAIHAEIVAVLEARTHSTVQANG